MGTRLKDDVVLITGSTRGIGRAIADRCASEGAGVVVTGRTQPQGEQAVAEIEAAGGRAIFVRTDVSDEAQIRAAVDGSGLSRYRICREIGVAQATMSRFMNGKGGLSCVDVVFGSDGATVAKSGRLIYTRGARLMSTDFKPTLYQQ